MSGYLEHTRRWQNRPQPPRHTTHWTPAGDLHTGPLDRCGDCNQEVPDDV